VTFKINGNKLNSTKSRRTNIRAREVEGPSLSVASQITYPKLFLTPYSDRDVDLVKGAGDTFEMAGRDAEGGEEKVGYASKKSNIVVSPLSIR